MRQPAILELQGLHAYVRDHRAPTIPAEQSCYEMLLIFIDTLIHFVDPERVLDEELRTLRRIDIFCQDITRASAEKNMVSRVSSEGDALILRQITWSLSARATRKIFVYLCAAETGFLPYFLSKLHLADRVYFLDHYEDFLGADFLRSMAAIAFLIDRSPTRGPHDLFFELKRILVQVSRRLKISEEGRVANFSLMPFLGGQRERHALRLNAIGQYMESFLRSGMAGEERHLALLQILAEVSKMAEAILEREKKLSDIFLDVGSPEEVRIFLHGGEYPVDFSTRCCRRIGSERTEDIIRWLNVEIRVVSEFLPLLSLMEDHLISTPEFFGAVDGILREAHVHLNDVLYGPEAEVRFTDESPLPYERLHCLEGKLRTWLMSSLTPASDAPATPARAGAGGALGGVASVRTSPILSSRQLASAGRGLQSVGGSPRRSPHGFLRRSPVGTPRGGVVFFPPLTDGTGVPGTVPPVSSTSSGADRSPSPRGRS